jgi:putative spermidine/putrescine transport system ATP-binding protein
MPKIWASVWNLPRCTAHDGRKTELGPVVARALLDRLPVTIIHLMPTSAISSPNPSNGFPGCALQLDSISQRYGATVAVDDVSFKIGGGELLALLGPSGCGKTTLLRIIAGFVGQSAGRVLIAGNPIDDLPPNRREIGIVFQNYALFPHMTVADNIGYGLAARGVPRTEQRARIAEMLDLVQLSPLAARSPRQLSGGQQQRVALARALAVRPRILLLDEPFAALDKNLRLDMQIEVKRIQRHAGITTILVTHDQEEALSMADCIAVLNLGRLEQFGSPIEIYDAPRSLFVNSFVGGCNLLPGRLVAKSAGIATIALDCGAVLSAREPVGDIAPGDRIVACIRPEHLSVTAGNDGLAGIVELGMPLGASIVHELRLNDGQALKIAEQRVAGGTPRPPGTEIRVAAAPCSVFVFTGAAAPP